MLEHHAPIVAQCGDAAWERIRTSRDAQRTRDEAVERSQDHVGEVHEATPLMLQRVDAMESELSALVESLRTGANRLNADLSLLAGNMGELYDASGRGSRASAAAPIVEDIGIVEVQAQPAAPPPVARRPRLPPRGPPRRRRPPAPQPRLRLLPRPRPPAMTTTMWRARA